MHSSTWQTLFFANHGLHPKFDIQGMHKVVNLIVEDQTMWLIDVRAQLVDEHWKEQPSFKVGDQFWF